MALPPTSSIRFRASDFSILPQPREWQPAIIEINGLTVDWRQLKLTVQGLPQQLRLEVWDGEDVILADWERRGTGRYRIVLSGGVAQIEERTVTVVPEKISAASYAAMLEDLEEELPTSIVVALNKLGGLAGVDFAVEPRQSTLAQQVLRLRRAINGMSGIRPGLADVLVELADAPHHILRTEPVWTRADRARRPIASQLARVVSAPNNITKGRKPRRIIDGRVEPTVDVVENRLLKLFVLQVKICLRRVQRLVDTRRQDNLATEMATLARRLAAAEKAAQFLESVRLPTAPPTSPTMVMLKRPAYRATLEGWLEFNRSQTVRIDLPSLDSPLENVPSLYESWGTLRIIAAVLEHAQERGYQCAQHQLVSRSMGELVVKVLPNGRPAVVLTKAETGRTIHVVPQFTYGKTGQLASISFSQQPDVSVQIFEADGTPKILLFDPKYKLDSEEGEEGQEGAGKPKKVDIDKMHAYRDAIRGPEGEAVVSYAAILYPGAEQFDYGGQVGALTAVPGKAASLAEGIHSVLDQVM